MWIKTTERYVAFLDIMGFTDMISRKPHHDVLKIMKKLGTRIKWIEKMAKDGIKKNHSVSIVRPIFFSDSILLVSNNNSITSLQMIIALCKILTLDCLKMNIPLKGAIALGKQTADFERSLHFGQALIDAYLLQSDVFFYGTVFHHSVELNLPKTVHLPEGKRIFRSTLFDCSSYETPFKKAGKIKHFVVDWTSLRKRKECLNMVNKLYLSVSGEPRKYVDNTVVFINTMKPSVS